MDFEDPNEYDTAFNAEQAKEAIVGTLDDDELHEKLARVAELAELIEYEDLED